MQVLLALAGTLLAPNPPYSTLPTGIAIDGWGRILSRAIKIFTEGKAATGRFNPASRFKGAPNRLKSILQIHSRANEVCSQIAQVLERVWSRIDARQVHACPRVPILPVNCKLVSVLVLYPRHRAGDLQSCPVVFVDCGFLDHGKNSTRPAP